MDRREIVSTVAALNRHIREHEISDFRIEELRGEALRLAGSFDLSYYHDLTLTVTGVSRLELSCDFYVDLAEPQPFSVQFCSEDIAVLSFIDCGARQRGEIFFEGELSFQIEHVSYH